MKRILVAISTLAIAAAVSTPALADMALATSKNCMACHAVEKKLVGPSYKDIATKYAGQADAVDKLAGKVIKGGSGAWGPVPMPANAQINDADAKKLVAWILAGSK
jgi:cytochrome c